MPTPRSKCTHLVLAAILCTSSLLSQADEVTYRRPGHYIVWASNVADKCKATVRLVNGFPHQDVLQAAYDKRQGFLSWEPLSALDLGRSVSYISLPFSAGTTKYVLDLPGSLSNVIVDSLYFAETLPTNREELARVLVHNVISSSMSQARFEQLRKRYGNAWKDWFISSHFVAAYGRDQPIFFAIDHRDPDYSTRILVFQIDEDGARNDLCMLRRICSCARSCPEPFTTPRERADLIPSARFCGPRKTGALSNTTPHPDARDVLASASFCGARAGGRER